MRFRIQYKMEVRASLREDCKVHHHLKPQLLRNHGLISAAIMVSFTYLSFVASAVCRAIAAPASAAEPEGPPDFEIGFDTHHLARRQDYNQNYRTGGNVQFSPTNNGYSVSFSNAGDFVVGKGWRTGTSR